MAFGWIAAATVASSLLGADASKSAADTQANAAMNAANTQAAAGDRATQAQQQMFNTINDQQAPWRQAGATALGQIGAGTQPGGQFAQQYQAFTPYKDFTPYPDYKPFTAADLTANLAPNYQFQLEQGLNATKNAGNLQTGLLSGNTLRAVNDYAQNYAGNAYQQAYNNYNQNYTTGFNANQQNYTTGFNANKDNYLTGFNTFQTNQGNIFNRLSAIAGLGQTANSQTAQAGTTTAGNIGNVATTVGGQVGASQLAAGASQAAGRVGVANAISGGANNAASWYSLPSILNYGKTPTPSVGAPTSAGDYYTDFA